MRQGAFTLDNLMRYVYDEQISKIPTKMYNDDAQVKYLEFGSLYTYCCHGSKEHQIKRWLRERIAYVDSMLGYFTSVDDQITIRMNKTGYVEFEVTPYIPLYLSVKWSNAVGGTQTFKVKRGETQTFYYTSTTSTDQEIIIPYASHIKRLDNLSNLVPSSCILSNAKKLTNVEIHSNELYNLNVTNNIYLRNVDLENCVKLGTVVATGSSLDLSNCKYLQTVNVYNTALTEVQLNTSGGSLVEIYYPRTIQSIQLIKQRLLKTIGLPYGDQGDMIPTSLYNVDIQDCPNIIKLNTSSDPTIYSSFASIVYCNNLTLRNSLDLQELKFEGFHRLKKVVIENMYDLEVVGFNDLLPVGEASTIEYIGLSNCPLLETVELNCSSDDYEITFGKNAILNFGGLFSLKNIVSNCVLKGVKTIIVPNNLEGMYFTNEYGSGYSTIQNLWVSTVCDVNTNGSIVTATHIDPTYVGIDFQGMNLKNIDLGALVNVPKAINFTLSPTTVNPNFNKNRDGVEYPYLQPIGTLDLSNYTESLAKFFDGVDLNNLQIICNKNLPQKDLSYCFYNSSFSDLSAITNLLSKVSGIENLDYCFYRTTIDSLDVLREITMTNNATMNYTFAECPNLKSLNNVIIPRNVVAIEGMFSGCPITIVNNMTVNVIGSISGIFKNCTRLVEINTFRIPNVTAVSNVFNGCSSLSILSGFEVPSTCTDISGLFNGCYALTSLSDFRFSDKITNATNWYPPYIENLNNITIDTDAVKLTNAQTLKSVKSMLIGANGDMSDLFNGCSLLREAYIAITGEVTSLARAFANCDKLETLSPFVIPETCTDLSDMLNGCSLIAESPILEIPNAVTNITNLFKGCTNITDISGITFNKNINSANGWCPPNLTIANNVTIKNNVVSFEGCATLKYCNNFRSYYGKSFNGCKELLELDNILILGENGEEITTNGGSSYFRGLVKIPRITFNPNCKWIISGGSFIFLDDRNLEEIDFGGGVRFKFTGTGYIIGQGENPKIKSIKNLKILSATERTRFGSYNGGSSIFNNIEYLDCTIYDESATKFFQGQGIRDISNIKFDESIMDMSQAFMGNKLLESDIVIPSHITNCSEMFKNCTKMTHIHSNWENKYNFDIVSTDCYSGCTAMLYIDGKNVIAYEGDNALDYVPTEWGGNGLADDGTVSIFEVTIPSNNFAFKPFPYYYNFSRRNGDFTIAKDNHINWGDGESFSTSEMVSDTGNQSFPSHTYAKAGKYYIKGHIGCLSANPSWGDGSDVPYCFDNRICITGIIKWATRVYDASSGYYNQNNLNGCFKDLTNLKYARNLQLGNTVKTLTDLFRNCTSLTSIDFSGCDTSSVTHMGHMFRDCSSLTSLDLSNFNTSKVTSMEYMFYGCSSLASLDLSNFNTSNVVHMNYMFNNCSSLTSLDLSSFNTSNVTHMEYIFYGCKSIVNFISFKNISTSYDISSSNSLTVESLLSIIDNLVDTGETNTLTIGSTNLAKLTSAQIKVATDKGWTIV